jgi:hypothetical protein
MAKKETAVELKPKVEKISDSHLKELQGIINRINNIQIGIGRLEHQKHQALHDLVVSNDKVGEFQNLLMKEYGSFDVNIKDGTINWGAPKNEK